MPLRRYSFTYTGQVEIDDLAIREFIAKAPITIVDNPNPSAEENLAASIQASDNLSARSSADFLQEGLTFTFLNAMRQLFEAISGDIVGEDPLVTIQEESETQA